MVQALRRFDGWVARALFQAKLWALWPLVYGVALGAALWSRGQDELFKILSNNKVPWPQRLEGLRWIGIGIAAVSAIYVLANVGVRLRHREWRALAVASRLNRLLAWTVALPVVAWLAFSAVEKNDPILTALLAAVAAGCVAVSVYALRLEGEHRWPRSAQAALHFAAPVCVGALALAYSIWFSHLAITQHQALSTRTIDLGYYDNIFYQSIHGRPLGCTFLKGQNHISAHFDPLLVLMSPLYLLYPRAELLLVLQSVWLATGAVPLYLIAQRVLQSRGAAVVLVIAYLAYPALHGANMYEFHSLTLITPLVLWLMYFLERGAFIGYWVMLVLLWLTREDVPLLVAFVGLYAILDGRQRWVRAGWITIVLSVAYFVFVKKVVMPTDDFLNVGKESYGFAYYFDALIPQRKGVTELVLSLLTNPIFAFKHFFADPKKQLYLLLLFLPLAFLPFLAAKRRVMLAYGLLFCLAATREPVYTVHFQYSCVIFPLAFAMTPAALERASDLANASPFGLDGARFRRALLGFILVASLLLSWKFGGAVDNHTFRGGFARVHRSLDERQRVRYAALEQMLAQVEPGASVAVTNVLGPHVSNRERVYFYRPRVVTDYVLVWDREVTKDLKTWHDARVSAGELVEIGRHDNIQLYRRASEVPLTPVQRGPRVQTSARPPRRPPPAGSAGAPGELLDDRRDLTFPGEGGSPPAQ